MLTCEIAKKEILWFILQFVPFVNIVVAVLVSLEIAKKFGKSELFGVGLAFLGFIFYPILAFGDAKYRGRGRRLEDEYDDEDYDDGPRRRRRDDDYDDEGDDRPPRRRR